MKAFEIFKPGTHTSASGHTLAFSEADLERSVRVYDPAIWKAPIVVGHPKDNGPAYGWIAGLDFADGVVTAEPEDVDPDFAELVRKKRFPNRSASFYAPNSANHPLKGTDNWDTYYPRHVGFLGAQPPALKGLKAVEFSADEEGVIEFVESSRYAWGSIAAIMRSMREAWIAKFGIEDADKLIPNYYLSDVDAAARAAIEETKPSDTIQPAFSEDRTMTLSADQIAALQVKAARADALEAENATLKGDADKARADFAELQAKHDTATKTIAIGDIKAAIQPHVTAGKVLPAEVEQLASFAASLDDGSATFDFGEGDGAKKLTARGMFLEQLAKRPKVVDFSEHSRPDPDAQQATLADAQKVLMSQFAGAAK